MPTLAEQWMEKGEVIGLEKGEAIGLEKGKKEATLDMLRRYLATRFDLSLGHFDADFASLTSEALNQLSQIIFTIKTLPEFEVTLTQLKEQSKPKKNDKADKSAPSVAEG